jgi:hypothetical protein
MAIFIHDIQRYIAKIDKIYRQRNAAEHSYQSALQTLFKQITTTLVFTNKSFQLFVDGAKAAAITIAKENNGAIIPDKKQFDAFMDLAR